MTGPQVFLQKWPPTNPTALGAQVALVRRAAGISSLVSIVLFTAMMVRS